MGDIKDGAWPKGRTASFVVMAWIRSKIVLIAAAVAVTAMADIAFAADQVLLRAREGAAAMFRGQFERAVALYDGALGTPDVSKYVQASIYSDRGVAKWRMKQTKEAIDDFNESILLSPDNPIVYNNRGNALMDLGHPQEAIKDFDRAIALQPDYGAAYNNRGNAYAVLNDYGAAFRSFRKAASLLPNTAAPFNGRGRTHTQLQRNHAALRDLSRAIRLDQKYAAAYRNRATANFTLGNFKDAADDATQALNLELDRPQPDFVLLRAKSYAGINKFREAIADFDRSLELNPELVEAYVERGVLLAKNKRYDAAIADFDRAIEMDPKNAEAFAMRAEVKLKQKSPDEALVDTNSALLLSLGDPLALRVRGNIYEAQERVGDAVYDYQKALAKDPFQEESRSALVRLEAELPGDTGQPLGPEVSGWIVKERAFGRYTATNPDYPALSVELEMFGGGKPTILDWTLKKGALSGIGLLKYYAGSVDGEGDLEYVAIVDTRAKKVVSIEPERWGDKPATWTWQAVAVTVTDPDGHANELALRRARKAAPVARRGRAGGGQSSRRKRSRRKSGGGSPLDWLFR